MTMEMAMPGTPAWGGPSWLWELSALAFAVSSVPPHILLHSPDPSPLQPRCFLLQEALLTIRGEGSLSPIVLCCFTIADMQVIPLKWRKVKMAESEEELEPLGDRGEKRKVKKLT